MAEQVIWNGEVGDGCEFYIGFDPGAGDDVSVLYGGPPNQFMSGPRVTPGSLLERLQAELDARIPFDGYSLDGQGRSEYKDCPFCRKIRAVWNERSPINETAESLERDDLRVTATIEVLRACGVVHTCRDEIQPA